MMVKNYAKYFLIALLMMIAQTNLLVYGGEHCKHVPVNFSPNLPPWVKPATLIKQPLKDQEIQQGGFYLLDDTQTQVFRNKPGEIYQSTVFLYKDTKCADIPIRFVVGIKELESLSIHWFRVVRGTNRKAIWSLKPEMLSDFNKKISAGKVHAAYSFEIENISELRGGDLLEYAYTKSFRTTASHLIFASFLNNIACTKKQLRILWDKDIPYHLSIKYPPSQSTKLITPSESDSALVFKFFGLKHQAKEENSFTSFCVMPKVYMSNYMSWSTIANYLENSLNYKIERTQPLFMKLIKRIKTSHFSPTDQFLEAIRYVQDSISYYCDNQLRATPLSPEKTLQSQRGDCKDQSTLLKELLRTLGGVSYMALVHTIDDGRIAESFPPSFRFNHGNVVLEVGKRLLLIDPTKTYQGGTLDRLVPSRFSEALVLGPTPSKRGLLKFPSCFVKTTGLNLQKIYDLRQGLSGPISFSYTATFMQRRANDERSEIYKTFGSWDVKKLQERFLKNWPKRNLDITSIDFFEQKDDRYKNCIQISASMTLSADSLRKRLKKRDNKWRIVENEIIRFVGWNNFSSRKTAVNCSDKYGAYQSNIQVLLPDNWRNFHPQQEITAGGADYPSEYKKLVRWRSKSCLNLRFESRAKRQWMPPSFYPTQQSQYIDDVVGALEYELNFR